MQKAYLPVIKDFLINTGCKCSITNSCVKNNTYCNCDANDKVWRHDSGFVTDKNRLPLTEVRIGDTGSSVEKASYTIGAAQCTEY